MLDKSIYILFFVVSMKSYECVTRKVTYMEMQHPVTTFVNSSYAENVTIVSKRLDAKNPLYFMTVSGTLLVTVGRNTELHFYAYEKFLDGYKRSFVEVHVNFCDFLNEDGIFSKILLWPGITDVLKCPLRPGNYNVENIPAAYGPYLNALPFTTGRIYLNITYKVTNMLFTGYFNMNIKEMNKNLFNKYMKEGPS